MKIKYLIVFFGVMSVFDNHSIAQDKQFDYRNEDNPSPYCILPCGNEEYLLLFGNGMQSTTRIMKFGKELEPLWAKPLEIPKVNYCRNDYYLPLEYTYYTYINPENNAHFNYIYGRNKFLQILPNGTYKEVMIRMPRKEVKDTAAIFTDALGFNVVTITGKGRFKSGRMTWYSFTHDRLESKKVEIVLPLPPSVPKRNRSGWKLSSASPNGLYFYYVSYRDYENPKDFSILVCHFIKVDRDGKAGKIISLDMKMPDHHAIPALYSSNNPGNLKVFSPDPIRAVSDGKASVDVYYNDLAYLGAKVDEKNNRLYTVVAINYDPRIGSEFNNKVDFHYEGTKIKTFLIKAYDLEGKNIYEIALDHEPIYVETGFFVQDLFYRTEIELSLLAEKSGLIIKVLHFGNSMLYVVDKQGEKILEGKAEIFSYSPFGKETMAGRIYFDKFNSTFVSIEDIKNSFYVRNEASAISQNFSKLEDKAKMQARYLSLKNCEILAYPNFENKSIKLNYFKKNRVN